jgi:hypothetical protein
MYKWAGADYVEKEFLAGLPGVVRFLFDHFWWVAAVQSLVSRSAICMEECHVSSFGYLWMVPAVHDSAFVDLLTVSKNTLPLGRPQVVTWKPEMGGGWDLIWGCLWSDIALKT